MTTRIFVWVCVQDRWRNSPPFAWLDDWEHAREYFDPEVMKARIAYGIFNGPRSRRIWFETRKGDQSSGEQTVSPLQGEPQVFILRAPWIVPIEREWER